MMGGESSFVRNKYINTIKQMSPKHLIQNYIANIYLNFPFIH